MKNHKFERAGLRMAAGLGALALAASAEAGSRHFTYTYETTTMSKGAMEFESWATWKTSVAESPGYERFDMRHEFEYGVTDRFQLALYLVDWRYEKNSEDGSESTFQDVALEAIYNLTDPNTTAFGSAVYGEIKGSDEFIELEAKLLLQKNIGSWILAYNIGGEIEWEDEYTEDEAELAQSLGVCYQVSPSFSVGAEVLHEVAVPDVDTIGDSGVYAGPNLMWRHDKFSAALTGLWQLTTLDGEPDFQLRTILSYDF